MRERAECIVQRFYEVVPKVMTELAAPLASTVFDVESEEAAIEMAHARGWTDGLPIIPPTEARVRRFLDYVGREPDEVLGEYDRRNKVITVEKVAVNAVMAGCLPEHFPVVLSLTQLTFDGGAAPGVSTSGTSNLFVVNGPIRHQLKMNCKGDVFGPGNRANASIGRALSLVYRNAFGSVSGAGNDDESPRPILDRGTLGSPARYVCYHLVENEEAFPELNPLHVERGFARDESVVTSVSVHWHAQLGIHKEGTGREVLDTVSHHIRAHGLLTQINPIVLVFSLELATHLVRDGFTKSSIAEYVFESTRRSRAWMKEHGYQTGNPASPRVQAVEPGDDEVFHAAAATPADIMTVVAGGVGGWAQVIYPYWGRLAASRAIEIPQAGGVQR